MASVTQPPACLHRMQIPSPLLAATNSLRRTVPFSTGSRHAYRIQRAVSAVAHGGSSTAWDGRFDRRTLLLSGVLLLHCRTPTAQATTIFKDERDNFTISVPEEWSLSQTSATEGKGPTAMRRTLAWFEEADPSTYVTVTVTNLGADYTSLGSFGTAEQFGSNLVASMDQSFLKRAPKWASRGQPIQEAKLLAAKENDKIYNIEYTIKKGAEQQRHLLSVIAMGYNGRYNRLYTVTAQCNEPDLQQRKATLQQILASFSPPPPVSV